MFPATIKQLVTTNCMNIKVRIIQIISSYFLVVSSWKEPKAYFHIVHIVARFFHTWQYYSYKGNNLHNVRTLSLHISFFVTSFGLSNTSAIILPTSTKAS